MLSWSNIYQKSRQAIKISINLKVSGHIKKYIRKHKDRWGELSKILDSFVT